MFYSHQKKSKCNLRKKYVKETHRHSCYLLTQERDVAPWYDVSLDRSLTVDTLSCFTLQPVLHNWCNKGHGIYYPICGMMHIKDPLLLIRKRSRFPLLLSQWSSTIINTTAFVTPVVEHWLEWEITQWVHHEGSIWRPIASWANALTTELPLTPLLTNDVHNLSDLYKCQPNLKHQ